MTRQTILIGLAIVGVLYVASRAMGRQQTSAGPYDRYSDAFGRSTFPGAGKGQADAYNGN